MKEKVPLEAKGSRGPPIEGKFIIDKPLRVKSCSRCWTPLRFKDSKLFCDTCKKFRTAKTSQWLDHRTNLEYLTELEIKELLGLPAFEGSGWMNE